MRGKALKQFKLLCSLTFVMIHMLNLCLKAKIAILFFLLASFVVPAASFNHPELRWKVLETSHFLVHYHQNEETFAQEVANAAEEVYPHITSDLGYEPLRKTPIIIENYNDATGGYTSILTGKIVIQAQSDPNLTSGDLSWAKEVIAHEFTHVVTFAAIEESLFPLRRTMANLILPMWFVEGLAEYEGEKWHSLKEMVVGDEAREKKIMSEGDLGAFYFFEGWGRTAGYYQSESFLRYILRTYGRDKIAKILSHLRSQPLFRLIGEISLTTGEMNLYPLPRFISFNRALVDVIGKSSSALYAEWRSWIMNKYKKESPKEPPFIPERLLTPRGRRNQHPVFSPSGDRIAFVSNRGYDYAIFDLYLMDVKERRARKLAKGVNPFISFSPDGEKIIYSRTTFYHPKRAFLSDLYFVDVKKGLETRLTFGLRASQPSFSPDGEKIVFVRKEGGNSNLYLMDLKTGDISPLTNHHDGLTQNFSPSFSPDGEKIAFTSFRGGQRDIYLLRLRDKVITPLTLDKADDRCPVFSPTGREIYFISDRKEGIFNLYSLDLETRKIKRYTQVKGGVFEPAISPDGKSILLSVYEKERFSVYLLSLEKLKGEQVPLKIKEKRGVIAEYRGKKRVEYPCLPYQPHLELQYILPWFSLSDGRSYFSLEGYACDVLEKHNLYFSTLLGEDILYDLAYINRQLEPTLWVELYKLTGRSGERVGLSYPLSDKQSVGMSFQTEERDTFLYDGQSEFWQGKVNSLTVGWEYTNMTPTCDSDLNPRGIRASLGVEYSGKDIGSDLEYTCYQAEWRGYKYVGEKNNFALRILGERIENREATPEKLEIVLEGMDALRGYPEDYSGENLALSSLEYRFLLSKRMGGSPSLYIDRLGGALFFDIGDAWSGDEVKLKKDWGVEFRLKILPFCRYSLILRLGIAWPLDYKDKEGRVFFNIGGIF